MSSIDFATWFKVGMYLLNREKRLNAFPILTDIIPVLNELPTDKTHIAIHTSTTRKNKFLEKFFLSVLQDQTSVKVPLKEVHVQSLYQVLCKYINKGW